MESIPDVLVGGANGDKGLAEMSAESVEMTFATDMTKVDAYLADRTQLGPNLGGLLSGKNDGNV